VLVAQHPASAVSELLGRLGEAREQSDKLFGIVRQDSLYERPIPERHRIVFYLGHLDAFDWNLLREPAGVARPFDPQFDRLFAFGIDPVGGGLPSDLPADWPSLTEVHRYNAVVREKLDARLGTFLTDDTTVQPGGFSPSVLLHVAIEHRLMHVETLAYMFHQLPHERKLRPQLQSAEVTPSAIPIQFEMVEVPAGSITLGLASSDSGTFGWDNEYQAHSVHVPSFAIDRYKVTNGQFLEFLNAGGYEDRAYWSESDWNWRMDRGISHPGFWSLDPNGWHYRAMFEDIPLPLDWPVYVSRAEAAAYARWARKSLPTEAQWQRAAYGTPQGGELYHPRPGNCDFLRWDPAPVNAFPDSSSASGAVEMVGNGWEWTASPFAPFPGFEPFPFYPGYSANFFDGQHFVMKGASPRTAACMLRPSFRNWFQPHYPYMYAGFRCVTPSPGGMA
jgi:iron(II)-dependent oxidoreductase